MSALFHKSEKNKSEEKEFGKTEHYFSQEQHSQFVPKKILVSVGGLRFELWVAKGVFSSGHLDTGSRLLIESAIVPHGASVLDLGCGYGVVGIALKKKNPLSEVLFSDVNDRALRLTQMNLALHKLKGDVVCSDGFKKIDSVFDVVALNPPQSAGKALCFRLIEESVAHLKNAGSLQLVARPSKGGKTLAKKMEDVFGNVSVIGKGCGFQVYRSVKKSSRQEKE